MIISMPGVDTRHTMTPSTECSCCPYGFHIDRDFVRYCDSLYNSTQLDKLRQHKRERRKEKKSVESYLGLGRISPFEQNDKNHHQHAILPSTTTDTASAQNFYLHSDGLKDAVVDFEDTWQKTLRKGPSSSIGNDKSNYYKTRFETATTEQNLFPVKSSGEIKESHSIPCVKSRSSSTSSISSHSTAVSNTSALGYFDGFSRASDVDQWNNSSLSKSSATLPHTMGIHKSMLTNIREQMASSLCRMKELEDQVKCIPILQVKLSALKEEKKALLKQLSLKESLDSKSKTLKFRVDLGVQLKKLENQGIMSPTMSRKFLMTSHSLDDLSSPAIASSLDATLSNQNSDRNAPFKKVEISHENISVKSKQFKSIGTSCSVLTRDIGVGYVPCKFKSVAVGCDFSVSDNLKYFKSRCLEKSISVSSESLDSDLDSLGGVSNIENSIPQYYGTVNGQIIVPLATLKPSATVAPLKCFVDSSTNTDVKYINKSINTENAESKFKDLRNSVTFKNKSILAVPYVCAKSVQASDVKFSKSVGVQVFLEENIIKNKTNGDFHSLTRSSMSGGDLSINNSRLSCENTKKATAVGDYDVRVSLCDKCTSVQTISTASGPNHSYNASTLSYCDKCQQEKVFQNQSESKFKTIGINTNMELPSSLNVSNNDIQICDKCSATIQCVAKDLAADTVDSKIPKLNLSFTSSKNINKMSLSKPKTQSVKPLQIRRSSREKTFQANFMENNAQGQDEKPHDQKNYADEKTSEDNSEIELMSPVTEILPDFTDLPALPRKKVQLGKEILAACKVLNDNLQKPEGGNEKKTLSSLNIIQREWFKIANQKNADPLLIEDYLDAFEEFSKLLLHRIVNLSDTNGNTALHYAVSYGNFDVVSILIDSKVCDVNKKNKAGYTSIMLVALADMRSDTHHYVVQRLFSIGDINEKATQNGQTALMLAVSHGKKDIVKILLDVGAEVNLQDKDGSTALMCAAEHGQIEIVKLLLSHSDCDPTILDNDGCNALTIAMEAGHKDIGLLIYTNMNFSRGNSPYSTLKSRKRSTPPPRTPTLRTPPLPSPSARSTSSLSSFQFLN
ncbi:KN motif and ankyrin repeat domain-containing protein 2-like [Uloborus diversus]|uniref:KN motif and ankyrin repeat domain-containing protein 2-like n=1 Tax=Uloborus diversus TaxID=327109 RepID=UPI002409E995|nr:KN motif and ankyrin repeat domain-containing protein 2-like [Uloborus diversus]